MARLGDTLASLITPLTQGWEMTAVDPGKADDPAALAALASRWVPAQVPGTVASALRSAREWHLDSRRNFDAEDFWYRCPFALSPPAEAEAIVLDFGGLATLADVWLNGEHVLHSTNMFMGHELDVTKVVRESNELLVRFGALAAQLAIRRPRPKWRTRLVDQQQLRWFRTTLLGRLPGWAPGVAPVGPWRPVSVERRRFFSLEHAHVRALLDGDDGVVTVSLRLRLLEATGQPPPASLIVGSHRCALRHTSGEERAVHLQGELRLPRVQRWWPHTHGAQALYSARAELAVRGADVAVDLGPVGFRTLERIPDAEGGFGLMVNGERIFCRGACWTTPDIVTLGGPRSAYQADLVAARDAGMNMLRVGGTMVYEAADFYRLCDELGILVWQDFMFANMDYPAENAGFLSTVKEEVGQVLDRLQTHPSLAVLCGNSEVEQQVSMMGLPRELWYPPLFHEILAEICGRLRPDVPYVPSSPCGGDVPFQVDSGVAHYYGVGAYLRAFDDARRSGVRFASECLGFSNVPEPPLIEAAFGPGEAVPHHPRWKSRVPRDVGAGWDFEDIRDHYLRDLYAVDPIALRYGDTDRYLALARVTTGEVIARVFSEWRRAASRCNGGLVWFYRDLFPGAGWGLLDADGHPKAAYYHLKRVLAPIALLVSDEGLNGLQLHAVNDTADALATELAVALYRGGHRCVETASTALVLPPRSQVAVSAGALFPGFTDLNYAYKFGPPGHDLVVATLLDVATRARLGEVFFFPLGLPSLREDALGLEASFEERGDEVCEITIRTRRFAQSVAIQCDAYWPEDNYFHLAPGTERRVSVRAVRPTTGLRGTLQALNATSPSRIEPRP